MTGLLTAKSQAAGGDVWKAFNRHATTLEQNLQKLGDAVQELGSSLDLTRAVQNLHDRIRVTSWLFRENASQLFPRTVKAVQPPRVDTYHFSEHEYLSTTHTRPTAAHRGRTGQIHVELDALADGITILQDALAEFTEFGVSGHWPLGYFQNDIKYWTSHLAQYEGQFARPEVQAYVHDLCTELGDFFQETGYNLQALITRVPAVRLSQTHLTTNLQNIATIATFFSAVTATTLQYSITTNEGVLSQAVNSLWFSSLVFSITSAVNSSLALMWRNARYSPKPRIPEWLWIWIRQCPPLFLILSVISFLAGLGCFTISSQTRGTWITVLICEGFSCFSIAAILLWLAVDKWSSSYNKHQLQGSTKLGQVKETRRSTDGALEALPIHNQHDVSSLHISQSVPEDSASDQQASQSLPLVSKPMALSSLSSAQQLWQRAMFRLKVIRADAESKQMSHLQQCLPNISIANGEIRHQAGAAISDPEFSPDGSLLAISGKLITIYYKLATKIQEELKHSDYKAHQVSWAASGKALLIRTNHSVNVLSLNGDVISIARQELVNFVLGIPYTKIMSNSLPAFICIEGTKMNKLVLMDINGIEYIKHQFDQLMIQHVAFIPATSCLLLAATVTYGVKPVQISLARKLIVFNLETCRIDYDVPLWHNVQYVTVSQNGQMAIVTYRNCPSPQLWRLKKNGASIYLSLQRQLWTQDSTTRFAGRAQFLNKDQFILCTTTEGAVHFWRRDKDQAVHVIAAMGKDKDKIIEVACNPVSEEFMFATRSQDGGVRIWKVQGKSSKVLDMDITN